MPQRVQDPDWPNWLHASLEHLGSSQGQATPLGRLLQQLPRDPGGRLLGPCSDPWYRYCVAQLRIAGWASTPELGAALATLTPGLQLVPEELIKWVLVLGVLRVGAATGAMTRCLGHGRDA
jgi:hypothetical protein